MMTGLFSRDGRYSGKVIVPTDLQPIFGKKVIVRALKTSDFAEAKARNLRFRLEMEETFRLKRDAMRSIQSAAPKREPSDWEAMSTEQFHYEMERMEVSAREQTELEFEYEERAAQRERYEAIASASTSTLSTEDRALKDVIEDLQWKLETAQGRLAWAESRSNAETALSTGASREPPVVGADVSANRSAAASRSDVPTLTQVAELWAKGGAKPRTIKRTMQIVGDFERVNGVRPVSEYHDEDVLAYREWLVADGRTVENINVLIPMLGTVFHYAVKGLRIIKFSPTTGMKLADNRKASVKVRPFTGAELEKVFRSPIFTEDYRPSAGGGEAAYWLPLLALYTGGRQTELGQLYTDDVFEEWYVDDDGGDKKAWVIRFIENEARGQWVKNEGSERRVPVHAHLIELGFLRFLESAAVGEPKRLFPDIQPNSVGELMGNWSKWFGRYRRKVCGLTSRQTVFHSFRHSFKHYARMSRIEREVHHALTGHETGDSGDDYGKTMAYPLGPLVDAMARYRVPGFSLPSPPPGLSLARL